MPPYTRRVMCPAKCPMLSGCLIGACNPMPCPNWAFRLPELGITIDAGSLHNVAAFQIANFASPHLFPTVTAIVEEVAGMFDDELVFLGGDETACKAAGL